MRAIDADALIELLKREEEYLDGKGARERADGITDAIMDVIDAPTIEPERKGKWEIKKASIYPYGNDVCCSECGHTLGSSFGYKFCPMCGCKMEVEGRSEKKQLHNLKK